MSKRTKTTGVKECTCDKCGLTLISVPAKKHRRCGGAPMTKIRAKHSSNIGQVRGVWR